MTIGTTPTEAPALTSSLARTYAPMIARLVPPPTAAPGL